jgi:outer membrane protein assembly factor BamB
MKRLKILSLTAICLLSLTLVSCSSTTQSARGWSGTTIHEGVIYVGTVDGGVLAIDASNQTVKWDHTITPRTTIYTVPTVDDDLICVGTYSGQLYALTVDRGAERWVYPRIGSIGAIVGSPVIGNETIYFTSSDGMVYALDRTYGDFTWKSQPLAEKLWTSPMIQGDTLYVSTFDGHIYALSAETGELLDWSFATQAGFSSSPLVYGDTVYVGSFDRHLYAIEIGSDLPLWRFPEEKQAGNWFWASPIATAGVVYAGCLDGKVYAVNATTGKEVWEFDTGDPIVVSPVLMDSTLLVTNQAGNLYVFDLNGESGHQGVPSKAISINATVRSSFCAREGMAYIRGEDNQLHAVDIGKGEVSWKLSLAEKK